VTKSQISAAINVIAHLTSFLRIFLNNEMRENAWRGLTPTTHFCPRKALKARNFYRGAALTDEPALPKFLRDKVGFTFSVGGDMGRRRLAGMKPVSLSHH